MVVRRPADDGEGKQNGVDRCGDVFKHANAAGTSKNCGVLVLAGDDHAAKSSTLPHQSEHIFKACLIPVLNPDATTVASKQATSVSPNIVGLLAGHAYKISDLFTALLTISANDAAMALAQATGSLSQGMAIINAEAHHLQADDTVAVTPNGLDAPGQHVSAYDLALFARQALTPAGIADAARV